jgi:LPS sulfotransferase NodH
LQDWFERNEEVARLARQQQIFFVGGAPRSGTTWLQQLLDAHPDVCSKGEGLFLQHLAVPLEKAMIQRSEVIAGKNQQLFKHTGGYPLPSKDDTEFLIGTAILTALHQQCAGKTYRAVGEKTPENVFFYPRLRRLFPQAKFISIARDPRDVLTSAWHFFKKLTPGEDEAASKLDFIRGALPSMNDGARKMVEFHRANAGVHVFVTYDALRTRPAPFLAELFRFIGVSDDAKIVAECIKQTDFAVQTGGRPAGVAQNGVFHRKGQVGSWKESLNDEHCRVILNDLEWMFPLFGWQL